MLKAQLQADNEWYKSQVPLRSTYSSSHITDIKSAKHIEGSVKRRSPTIQGIARKYNVLCGEIQQMVNRKVAPTGAVVPELIPPGALWTLDVDDAIWQDIGLEDVSTTTPPLWLKDEKVRAGIRHLLNYDRALEEEERLLLERKSIQECAVAEWATLCTAYSLNGTWSIHVATHCLMLMKGDNPGVLFRLSREMSEHTRQCYRWRQDCRLIPCTIGECWGPSETELIAAGALEFTHQVDFAAYETDSDDCSSSEGGDDCWEDEELYEQMENMALRDAYSARHLPDEENYSSDDSVELPEAKKRKRA